jgi:Tfp pilus assembly protein PilW
MIRVLRRLRRDESGLSMAELLVAALLTSIVMVMVTSFFIQTAKLTTAAAQTRQSTGIAANVANDITSVVRMATTLAKSSSEIPDAAIVAGTRSSLTIYSYANTSATDPAPIKVTFTLDASGAVTETRCTGTSSSGFWTFGTCATTSTRTLGTGILAPTGVSDQLFTYRDGSGTVMSIGTGSLSATQRAEVSSILIQVRTQTGASGDVIWVKNSVVLRNLGLETTS